MQKGCQPVRTVSRISSCFARFKEILSFIYEFLSYSFRVEKSRYSSYEHAVRQTTYLNINFKNILPPKKRIKCLKRNPSSVSFHRRLELGIHLLWHNSRNSVCFNLVNNLIGHCLLLEKSFDVEESVWEMLKQGDMSIEGLKRSAKEDSLCCNVRIY